MFNLTAMTSCAKSGTELKRMALVLYCVVAAEGPIYGTGCYLLLAPADMRPKKEDIVMTVAIVPQTYCGTYIVLLLKLNIRSFLAAKAKPNRMRASLRTKSGKFGKTHSRESSQEALRGNRVLWL